VGPVFGKNLQATKAINFGYVEIDDENFGLLGNDLQRLPAIGSSKHLKISLLRLKSEKASDGVVVIDDNQLGFSRSLCIGIQGSRGASQRLFRQDSGFSMIGATQLQAMTGNSPAVILEILEDFKDEALSNFREVADLFSEGRSEEAKGMFHQLAGSAGTLGLSSLYSKVRMLEDECRRGVGCRGAFGGS